jgi:hydroxybutyrate-dimer hydrolase
MSSSIGATEPAFLIMRPPYIHGEVKHQHYDGVTDDLLTAGLGSDRLALSTMPGISDPKNPTRAELRRLAIYSNYRALVDTSLGGATVSYTAPM